MPAYVGRHVADVYGFGSKPAVRKAKILRVQPYQNDAKTIAAFFSAELPSGLRINDLKLMRGPKGAYWIGCPDQKRRGRDDQVLLDANGKAIWDAVIEFRDRAARDRFCELVLAALREANPELFDGEDPT